MTEEGLTREFLHLGGGQRARMVALLAQLMKVAGEACGSDPDQIGRDAIASIDAERTDMEFGT